MGLDRDAIAPLQALVTGASGVIGRALLAALSARGATVTATDRRVPRFVVPPRVRFVHADLLGGTVPLDSLVAGCDAVFHLAARMPQARLDEAGFHRANVVVTERLIEASLRNGVRRFLFASTTEVYGVQPIATPLTEDDAKHFTGPYSRNKWEVEQHLLRLGNDKMEAVALRMPMIFGPGFYHEKAIISLFLALRLGLPIPLPVEDAPVAFVSSRDTAAAFVAAAVAPGVSGQAFNIAAADHPTMKAFFLDVIRRIGSRSRPFVVPRTWVERAVSAAQRRARRPNDKVPLLGTPAELVPYILTGGAYSIARAQRAFGFSPQDTCADAWIGAYRWFWEQPWAERFHVIRQRV